MRTTTRRQFMAASGTAALLGAAGCSSGDTRGDDSGAGAGSATGEVEFWAWQAGLDTIVAEFNASQSDITVNYNVIPSGADAYKKIESAVKSGTGPDLAQVEAQQIPALCRERGRPHGRGRRSRAVQSELFGPDLELGWFPGTAIRHTQRSGSARDLCQRRYPHGCRRRVRGYLGGVPGPREQGPYRH